MFVGSNFGFSWHILAFCSVIMVTITPLQENQNLLKTNSKFGYDYH